MSQDQKPKVSVLMLAYNHERFIAQAVDSVLMQQTDFPVELVIGEDCSTDQTRRILMEYRDRYPDRIRLLLPDRNLGMLQNLVDTLAACQGRYIAVLEGDDFWTSGRKLQKQADFLDQTSRCALCFHNVAWCDQDGQVQRMMPPPGQKTFYTLDDLLVENIIPTCSVMFRARLFETFPDWFFTLKCADWPLHGLNARHGQIGYLNEPMAGYRVHEGGIWSTETRIAQLRRSMETIQSIGRQLGPDHASAMRAGVSRCLYQLAVEYDDLGDSRSARDCVTRSLRTRLWNPYVPGRQRLKLLAKSWFPRSYGFLRGIQHGVAGAEAVRAGDAT